MKRALSFVAVLAVAGSAAVQALDLDVTVQDIDRGLSIARSTDSERAKFHATYIKKLNTPVHRVGRGRERVPARRSADGRADSQG